MTVKNIVNYMKNFLRHVLFLSTTNFFMHIMLGKEHTSSFSVLVSGVTVTLTSTYPISSGLPSSRSFSCITVTLNHRVMKVPKNQVPKNTLFNTLHSQQTSNIQIISAICDRLSEKTSIFKKNFLAVNRMNVLMWHSCARIVRLNNLIKEIFVLEKSQLAEINCCATHVIISSPSIVIINFQCNR